MLAIDVETTSFLAMAAAMEAVILSLAKWRWAALGNRAKLVVQTPPGLGFIKNSSNPEAQKQISVGHCLIKNIGSTDAYIVAVQVKSLHHNANSVQCDIVSDPFLSICEAGQQALQASEGGPPPVWVGSSMKFYLTFKLRIQIPVETGQWRLEFYILHKKNPDSRKVHKLKLTASQRLD